ncbi:hypothetical protein QMZ92_16435 [Streptomyces sp. HNM0645]|nr:hypothetical protein [Streptomyces sp. HNM0645]MDI9885923.1 hypothetical protein [Streptomyces sp. HNM0645]
MIVRLLVCWFCGSDDNPTGYTICGFCGHDFRDDPNRSPEE